MSVETLSAVLHHSRAKGTAKLVMIGIANHDGDGGAWPTVATLCKYAGLEGTRENQARTLRRVLGKLRELGELEVELHAGGTGDRQWWERPNRYRVLVSCPPSCDRTTAHREVLTEQPELEITPPGHTTPPGSHDPDPPRVTRPGKPSTTNPAPITVPRHVADHARARRAPVVRCDQCGRHHEIGSPCRPASPERAAQALELARAALRSDAQRVLCPHCHEWHLPDSECPR